MLGILFWSLVPGWFLGLAAVGYLVKFSILAIKSIPQILGVLLGVILFPFFPFYGAYRKRNTDPEEAKRLFKVATILYSIAIVLGVFIWFITDTYYGLFLLYPVWTIWAFYYQRGRVYTTGEMTLMYLLLPLGSLLASLLTMVYSPEAYKGIGISGLFFSIFMLFPSMYPFCTIVRKYKTDSEEGKKLLRFTIRLYAISCIPMLSVIFLSPESFAGSVSVLMSPSILALYTGYYIRHKHPTIARVLYVIFGLILFSSVLMLPAFAFGF